MQAAAAYLRVSTDGQVGEDRFGLDAQREAIRLYAAANDLEIVAWYSDEGVSGGSLERPALKNLLSDAAEGRFSVLVVAKMDRIARDLMAGLWIEKELLKTGVELVSTAEPFRGADPANVLFRQIIGAFAQFEKSRIAERMSGGRLVKANKGGYAGGGVPLGYKATRGGKALALNAEKAHTIRRVFQLRDDNPGWPLHQLAAAMNREGHTTEKGCPFGKVQVKRILDKKDFYAGSYRYAGVEAPGKHQAII